MTRDIIPGYALDLTCACGRQVTLYEQEGHAPWINEFTRTDFVRFRCKGCGRHPVDMIKRWDSGADWNSSN